jgi:branched-chain amino acid transport system substrate-binding protein
MIVRQSRLASQARCAFVLLALGAAGLSAADAATPESEVEIAVALPTSGDEAGYGQGALLGVQLAIEDANREGAGPHIELSVRDDRSTDDGAKEMASEIVAGKAALVIGPTFSTASLAAGPIYANGKMASLPLTATSDLITRNPTTFRVIFKNTEQGETLALYLARVMGQKRAKVIVVDNAYGHTLQDGFSAAAGSLGITAQYFVFNTPEEAEEAARKVAADPDHAQIPVVLLTLDGDAARLLVSLRHLGVNGPFLGGDALGDTILSDRLAAEPEERRQKGYFTEGVYGISPMILDSANAEILSFAERFRARFGRDPVWQATVGYDAGRLAASAVRAAVAEAGDHPDTAKLRAAVLDYLLALNGPERAVSGLLGPIWFDKERGRQQAVRIGRFDHARFESAPVQVVPVTTPDTGEIASGAVFEMEPGRYVRLQRVVYTGVFINEVPRVDLTRASFGADFYLWMRYARDAGPGSPDPTDIIFPNMVSGSFNKNAPAEQGEVADGTQYRLWRVQGEFRNEFDLYRFPFDRQTLDLSFFHARAAADRIVYALDDRAPTGGAGPSAQASGSAAAASLDPPSGIKGIASPSAFRELTQWMPLGAKARRENLVTYSSLGDPRRIGAEGFRELSGFLARIDIERRALATLVKNLLPLFIMTLVMFASLYFPHGLVKEKVTVAITGALSGAVLLTAINNQLGAVGYTLAVEYAFYVFFSLSLLCILSVLYAERLRTVGHAPAALATERWTRVIFVASVAIVAAGAIALYANAPR